MPDDDDGPRRVVGVVLNADDCGEVRSLLLCHAGENLALPGGELAPGERPVPGMCRLLHGLGALDMQGQLWRQLDRCALAGREGGRFGVAFVLTARIAGDVDAITSPALFWASLAQVRHWAPRCPDATLPLLIAATMWSGGHGYSRPGDLIPESYFLGPGRDRQRVVAGG
jgi:hypothetical protein